MSESLVQSGEAGGGGVTGAVQQPPPSPPIHRRRGPGQAALPVPHGPGRSPGARTKAQLERPGELLPEPWGGWCFLQWESDCIVF